MKPPAGTVHVSAPLSVSDKAIDLFVRSKAGWIRLQQRGFHEQSRADSRQFVSGERFFYCGVAYELLVTAGRTYDLRLEGRLARLTAPTASTVTHRGAWLNEWLRRELKARVALRLPEIELRTGLHCNGWRIRNMADTLGQLYQKKRSHLAESATGQGVAGLSRLCDPGMTCPFRGSGSRKPVCGIARQVHAGLARCA